MSNKDDSMHEEKETFKGSGLHVRKKPVPFRTGIDESKGAEPLPGPPRTHDKTLQHERALVDTQVAKMPMHEETKEEIEPLSEYACFHDTLVASNTDGAHTVLPIERGYAEGCAKMGKPDNDDYDIEKGGDISIEQDINMDVEANIKSTGWSPSNEVAQEPGAVRVRGNQEYPPGDLDSMEEESREYFTVPEIQAELVDREEEERAIREQMTGEVREEIIREAPVAEARPNKCSPQAKRWLTFGGIVFVLLAIAIGVSLGMTLRREEPLVSLEELLSSVSLDGGEALRTQSTPQNMAYKWLANNTMVATYTDQRKVQRYTLATMYFSTNGTNWDVNTNWLDNGDECDRWAVSNGTALACTDEGKVIELDLGANNLVGSIPPELSLLSSSLVSLSLTFNKLVGTIPTEIGLLTALAYLELNNNQLSGPIPSEIGRLTGMSRLVFLGNQLSGTIPSEVGLLTQMPILDFEDNQLSGTIPSEIGFLTGMMSLWLDANQFHGTIPSEIGFLKRMWDLGLSKNQLTGTIPSIIQQMTNLDWVLLYDNDFTGNFTCPDFIDFCGVSCDPWDYNDYEEACRSL